MSKWSIKRVGKYFYIYEWSFIPLNLRSKKEKTRRYKWKYHGRIGTDKANNFINQLSQSEQDKIRLLYNQKVEELKKLEEISKELQRLEHFKQQKQLIYQIDNTFEQHNARRRYQNKLLTLAKVHLDKEAMENKTNGN